MDTQGLGFRVYGLGFTALVLGSEEDVSVYGHLDYRRRKKHVWTHTCVCLHRFS